MLKAGTSSRIMPESKMTAASAPRSSASRNSTIEWPPVSSSPSQAKRTLTGSVPAWASARGAGQQHVELALVVGDTTAVEPVFPDLGLERFRLPQVQRIGRLHVEVSVTEHRRRRVGIRAGPDLTDSQGLSVPVDDLTGSAGIADQVADPFAGADHVRRVLGSALIDGMRRNCASSSNHSLMEQAGYHSACGPLAASPVGARVAAALRSRSSRSASVGQASTARFACFSSSPLSSPSSITG